MKNTITTMKIVFTLIASLFVCQLFATDTILVAWDGGEGSDYASGITIPDGVYGFLKPGKKGILDNAGSNDGTFGATLSGAENAGLFSYKVNPNNEGNSSVTITIKNVTANKYFRLDSIVFDYGRWSVGGGKDIVVIYSKGDLFGVIKGDTLAEFPMPDTTGKISDYNDYLVDLSASDKLLLPSDSAVFVLKIKEEEKNYFGTSFDNIAIIGSINEWTEEDEEKLMKTFQPYNTQGDNLIHIAAADFDGVGVKDYVVAMDMDSKIIAFDRPMDITDPNADNRLWEYETGLFNIMITTGEANSSSDGDEVLIAGTDGYLRILSAAGELLSNWEVGTGALYAVDAGKTSSGEIRIISGGVDGEVRIYDQNGSLRKTFEPRKVGVIKRVVVGNYDGIGGDEIAVLYKKSGFANNNFLIFYDLDTEAQASYWNPEGGIFDSDLSTMGWSDKDMALAYDMDEDGDDELVANWGVLHPEDGATPNVFSERLAPGERLIKKTHYEKVYEPTSTGGYITRYSIAGNFKDSYIYKGTEMVTVFGDDFHIFNYDTTKSVDVDRLRGTDYGYSHSLYHFISAARLEDREGGLDKLVLAGPHNGDDHFYVVDMSGDRWKEAAKRIDREGVLVDVRETYDEIGAGIDNFDGVQAIGDIIRVPMVVSGAVGYWTMTEENINLKADLVLGSIQKYRDWLGGNPKKVKFYARNNAYVFGNEALGNITEESIVAWCKALTDRGVPASLVVGHGPHVFITPENLVQCYEATFVNGKSDMMVRTRELGNPEDVEAYIPILDALQAKAREKGVKPPVFMMLGKGATFTGMGKERAALLFPKYNDMLVLGVENSNTRMLDWSFSERMGLWMSDQVRGWGCNTIGDNLTAARVAEWTDMRNAHVVFRHLMSQYASGAQVFRSTAIYKNNPLFERGDITDSTYMYQNAWRQGFIKFFQLVEKGIYPSVPDVEQMKGVSPVAIAIPEPDARFANESLNHDWHLYAPQPQDYAVNNLECWNAYTSIPDYDMTSYLFNTKRRWENFLPSSPSGVVALYPYSSKSKIEQFSEVKKVYTTDVNSWDEFGTLEEARDSITKELESQKHNMLFYVDGDCFWQMTQQKGDRNILFMVLMDNNVLTPTERNVKLKKGTAPEGWTISDQLSNDGNLGELIDENDEIDIHIPAGGVRFLVARKTNPDLPPITNIPSINDDFRIYPNPSNETIRIELHNNEGGELEIFSLQGLRIYTQSIDGDNIEISLPQNIGGCVYLKITTSEGKVFTQKQIVIDR